MRPRTARSAAALAGAGSPWVHMALDTHIGTEVAPEDQATLFAFQRFVMSAMSIAGGIAAGAILLSAAPAQAVGGAALHMAGTKVKEKMAKFAAALLEAAPEDIELVIRVHLLGALHTSQAAFAYMREQEYGRIIVTSSAAGLFGNFGQANYGAAKGGLIGLITTLALEGRRYNVLANAIAPMAATRMTEDIAPPEVLAALGIPSTQRGVAPRHDRLSRYGVHRVRVVSSKGLERFVERVGFVPGSRLERAARFRPDTSRESAWALPHPPAPPARAMPASCP